jgi:hypothetical protein
MVESLSVAKPSLKRDLRGVAFREVAKEVRERTKPIFLEAEECYRAVAVELLLLR